MLARQGIISAKDEADIARGLAQIEGEIGLAGKAAGLVMQVAQIELPAGNLPARVLAHHDPVRRLLDDRGRGHPVLRLEAARVGVSAI